MSTPRFSNLLQNILTGVLTVCALVITALLVRRELFVSTGDAGPPPVVRVSDWRAYATSAHTRGPAVAPVTLVEFSDFQCPYCRMLAARLDSLRTEYPREVRVVFRHFPLSSHAQAEAAAVASECAARQGRFWQMHDVLFSKQARLAEGRWAAYGKTAGVPDSAAFEACMARGDLSAIRRDLDAGERLGVPATPTLLINEWKLVGAPPMDSLRAYVRRAVSR